MNAAKRNARRRSWPSHLYEPRPGYFTWRNPLTQQTLILGRVPLSHAISEAIAANRHIADQTLPSLVAMLTGEAETIATLIGKMPAPPKTSSAKTFRSLDAIIRGKLGDRPCGDLTVKDCAELIAGIEVAGRRHQAQAVRGRLSQLCRFAQTLGWMNFNPAMVTSKPIAPVKRSRLSLEQFLKIREHAAEFLPRAMMLALVTGQDRSTVAAMVRSDVRDGALICQRSKTARKNAPIAIPLSLRLDVLGVTLEDVLKECSSGIFPNFVHHTENYPGTPIGSPVHVDRISDAFLTARIAAGIPDAIDGKNAPTFHEIRSLAKRLYTVQGNVDTQALLGHATEAMSKLYENTRDMVPILVKIDLQKEA